MIPINSLIDVFLGILNLGCYGIKIRRYVSNGFCTSRKAIRDTICEGRCLPMDELPWFPQLSKVISRKKREWRCVPDYVKRRKVTVFCNDGTKRRYRIPVVRTCKCKRYTKKQNMTNPPGQSKKASKPRWKTRKTTIYSSPRWYQSTSRKLRRICGDSGQEIHEQTNRNYTHLMYNTTKLYINLI